jgi:hypothetical protein
MADLFQEDTGPVVPWESGMESSGSFAKEATY